MIDTPAMPATCSSVARPVPLPLLRLALSIVILSWLLHPWFHSINNEPGFCGASGKRKNRPQSQLAILLIFPLFFAEFEPQAHQLWLYFSLPTALLKESACA
jgi:hypothetical protein